MTTSDDIQMAVHFLRFLCAPADFKRSYLADVPDRTYGAELREGYIEERAGLRLLFILGHEAVVSPAVMRRVPERAREYVNDLSVILTLFLEGDANMLLALGLNISDDGGGFEANAWAQLQISSGRLLEALGEPRDPPAETFDEIVGRYCSRK